MLTIYLDQNKWIDLAKADTGRPDGQQFENCLQLIRKAVRYDRVRLPIAFPHLHETARAPKLAQREILARLMTEFSRGVVLRTPQQMVEHGLRQAVRRTFGLKPVSDDLSPFSRGLEAVCDFRLEDRVAGMSSRRAAVLRSFMDTPAAWIDLLSYRIEGIRRTTIDNLAQIGARAAIVREDDRLLLKDSNEDEILRVFAARATLHFIEPLKAALKEIGRTLDEWGSVGPNQLLDFWFSIPCVRAQLELETAFHLERSKRPTKNDLADLNALGLAIPFCDVVVTEKFWVHTAKARQLDREFNTALYTHLPDLSTFLEATFDESTHRV